MPPPLTEQMVLVDELKSVGIDAPPTLSVEILRGLLAQFATIAHSSQVYVSQC